jgi:hypothetical protein
MSVDWNYTRYFKEIMDIRSKQLEIRLNSPPDIPCIIVRNWLRRKYYAMFLSKIGVILALVLRVLTDPPTIVRIYLWGPECLGEWQAVHQSGYFVHLGRSWLNGNGEALSSGDVSVNPRRVEELLRYPDVREIQRICSGASKLSLEQLVRLSYDVALNRREPTGSVDVQPEEAFLDVVKNTLCCNFLRGLSVGLFKESIIVLPEGTVHISCTDNPLDGSSDPHVSCLKIGPSNNLLTYHAIYFLNVVGFKATIASLSFLLSTHLLHVTVNIRRLTREHFRTRIAFRDCKQRFDQGRYEELTAEQLHVLEKLERLETERLRVAVAIENTARSVRSLLQQGAIKQIGRELVACGNVVETRGWSIQLDGKVLQDYYWTTMRHVHELNTMMPQLRARRHDLSAADQKAEDLTARRFTGYNTDELQSDVTPISENSSSQHGTDKPRVARTDQAFRINGTTQGTGALQSLEYDVALSFAGEDRVHAEQLAHCLKKHGVRVFYDKHEKAALWGKDLFEHLAYVYKDAARYCVMFISQHYANRLWTNHERKNAQARAFREKEEYILPIRLDDTEIPGLPETVACVDLRKSSIEEVCRLVLDKLSSVAKRAQ